jgi:hypothetical protein
MSSSRLSGGKQMLVVLASTLLGASSLVPPAALTVQAATPAPGGARRLVPAKLSRSAATGRPGAQRALANLERHLQQGGPVGAPRPRAASTATAPWLADQVLETQRRQNRENCAAAAQGANRVCNPTR